MAIDKIQTGLRLDVQTLKKITYIAKKQKRSLNAQLEYITILCVEEFEKNYGEIILEDEYE